MTKKIQVSSEIGPLQRVMVHRPDEGISRISPKLAEDLLFDDIVYVPKMQEEHDVFTNVLKAFIGKENVLETQDLLFEALGEDEAGKQEMIELVVDYEELPATYKEMLQTMSDEDLTDTLITGYYKKGDHFLFNPIPNFIFTRDIAVTINNHMVVTKAAKEARYRENFITRFIIWAHPIFRELRREGRIINLNKVDLFPPSKYGEKISIEGGDVMILNPDYLLIGCSERTTAHAIRSLSQVLFEKGVVGNVVQVNIPADRSYMHIDTVFTQIDYHDFVAYKPIVHDGLGSNVEVIRKDGSTTIYHTIKDFLKTEISPDLRLIFSGKGITPYQEREQWTDGCNLVAIRPGVALTYDRNPVTERAFKEAGYEVIYARDLLRAFEDGALRPADIEKTIITLPSNELSRARGGSHCMTCPIERKML